MKTVRVVLVNMGLRTRAYPFIGPPLGILALAAHVRAKLATDILIINQRLENLSPQEIARRAADFGPDVMGISSLTPFAHMLKDLTTQCRQLAPQATIVLGGIHASSLREKALVQSGVDIVVTGEGELSFEQILLAVRERAGFDSIPGLIWRDASGEVRTNPGSPPVVEELDSLPMPAYDLIDLPAYWRLHPSGWVRRRRYATLSSSRGCPSQCIYCHGMHGRKFRAYSAERLVDEMDFLARRYKICEFDFCDDNFVLQPQRVVRFSELVTRRVPGTRLSFPNGLRGDAMSQDVIDALADAGTYACAMSLESGSSRIQTFIKKHLNIPLFLENVRKTAARGIFVHGYCIMGFPTETEADLQATIDVACASDFHTCSFFTVTPFPGTPLHQMVQQTHPEKLEGLCLDERMNFADVRINLTDLPDHVLFAYQRKATRRFFLSPKRAYRIMRVHPQRFTLPLYIPFFLTRITKGLLSSVSQSHISGASPLRKCGNASVEEGLVPVVSSEFLSVEREESIPASHA